MITAAGWWWGEGASISQVAVLICLLPYEPEGLGGFSHHAGAERAALLLRNGFALSAAGRLVTKLMAPFYWVFLSVFVFTFTPCWASEVNNLPLLRHAILKGSSWCSVSEFLRRARRLAPAADRPI